MAFHPPVHREFVLALRILDAFGMPCAEAWRLLRPVSARLGIPRPSYSSVRRILIAERERKRRHAEELDELLAALFSGRFPYVTVEHKLVGLGPAASAVSKERKAAEAPAQPARAARSSSGSVTGALQAKRSQTYAAGFPSASPRPARRGTASVGSCVKA
jgi:hypothetical protein